MSKSLVVNERGSESKSRVQGLLQRVSFSPQSGLSILNYVDERLPTNRLPRLNVDVLAVTAGAQRIALDLRRRIALLAGTSILAGTLLAVNVRRVVTPSTGAGHESPGNMHRHSHSHLLPRLDDRGTQQLRLFGAREARWQSDATLLLEDSRA